MKNIRTAAAVLALTAISATAQKSQAQEFLWNVRFDTRLDNREYPSDSRFSRSLTYFTTRLTPVAGIGFGGYNSLMLGGEFSYDMGAKLSKRKPELILYYNYSSPQFKAIAGKFTRTQLIGSYSRAMISGSQTFYDNLLEGFALQYTPKRGYAELVLDWDGMQARDTRESFRVLSAGNIRRGVFTAGYSAEMYHLASSADAVEGVVDHIMAYPWAGAAFERIAPWFEKLTLSVGWLQAFGRERRGDNLWRAPGGGMIEFTAQKWKVGVRNQLYLGQAQMPFYETYGSRIYKGFPMFRTDSGIYNFSQIYWRPQVAKGVTLDLAVDLHYDGRSLGSQQTAWIKVVLDNELFSKKNRDNRRAR